jgi:site-specific DNA-methyltransferase (adenine-specific)
MYQIDEIRNKIICGDCIEVMKQMPDNCIDAIITDPPYGIGFMGRDWDTFNPEYIKRRYKERKKLVYKYDIKNGKRVYRKKPEWVRREARSDYAGQYDFSLKGKEGFQKWMTEVAKEMLRVAKPGATMLVFGGTRTYHRLACAIEDAGWIIKDCIMWIYGSGFPKANDISKELDKKECRKQLIKKLGRKPTKEEFRKVIGKRYNGMAETAMKPDKGWNPNKMGKEIEVLEPVTPEVKLWNGWKSHGLKPAYEPIIMAIKPNEGSYAQNALKWGVAGLNIDGARIPLNGESPPVGSAKRVYRNNQYTEEKIYGTNKRTPDQGRFPANIILECICNCDEVIEGEVKTAGWRDKDKHKGDRGVTNSFGAIGITGKHYGKDGKEKAIIHTNPECPCYMLDKQSGIQASRFFYISKASKAERNMGCEGLEEKENYKMRKSYGENDKWGEKFNTLPSKNNHPTVKPLKLMEYLCILTRTPFGGMVLDPFAGSGTTGMACKKLGRDYILIEKEPEYCKIAEARIKAIQKPLL